MRGGEARGPEVLARHDRNGAGGTRERLEGLEPRRRHRDAGIDAPARPLEHVHDVVTDARPGSRPRRARPAPGPVTSDGQGAGRGARSHRGDRITIAGRRAPGRVRPVRLSCSSPRPSRTSRTICLAPGHRLGKPWRAARAAPGAPTSLRRAGTTRWRQAPSQSGRSGSGWRTGAPVERSTRPTPRLEGSTASPGPLRRQSRRDTLRPTGTPCYPRIGR